MKNRTNKQNDLSDGNNKFGRRNNKSGISKCTMIEPGLPCQQEVLNNNPTALSAMTIN
jgi:hypothetical protein